MTTFFPAFCCFSAHSIVELIEIVCFFLRGQILSVNSFEYRFTPAFSFLSKKSHFNVVENSKLHNIGMGPIDITKEVDYFEYGLLRV